MGTQINGSSLTVPGLLTSAGRAIAVNSQAVDYTALTTDELILLTITAKTVTLPPAASVVGQYFTVKLTVAGTGTVKGDGAELIDAANTYSLAAQYNSVTVVSNGIGWQIIAKV